MSSIKEMENEIKKLKEMYKISRNENSKLTIQKKIEDLSKEMKAKKASPNKEPEKKVEQPVVEKEEVVEEKKDDSKNGIIDNMNRGKVAEPGSSIPESEDKKEDYKKNNKNNRH